MSVLKRDFSCMKGIKNRYRVWSGGMGIGISTGKLVTEVGKCGFIGTLSNVALDEYNIERLMAQGEQINYSSDKKIRYVEAVEREVYDVMQVAGVCAMNAMVRLPKCYDLSIEAMVRGGGNVIVSGAGLPSDLPTRVNNVIKKVKNVARVENHDLNLVPITSLSVGFRGIIKSWDAQGYRPDAVVVEGPKAGGHIGWPYKRVNKYESYEEFMRENELFKVLLPKTLELAHKFPNSQGDIPVIVAGGIFTHEDIEYALSQGASGVQMGTRFVATYESGASQNFKEAIVNSKEGDNVLATEEWGSPCGYPFRYLKSSPLFHEEKLKKDFCICCGLKGATPLGEKKKQIKNRRGCPEGDILIDGEECLAKDNASRSGIFTTGTEAHRINKIVSVRELADELIGLESKL